jgi:hypothetical protein
LRYELDVYREFQRSCPKVGHPVKDEAKGEGMVEKIDVVREQIQIRYGGGDTEKFTPQEFVQLTNWRPEMPKTECICTCGKREAAPVASAPVIDDHPRVSETAAGEKITLLAGGGIGMKNMGGAGEIQVGTNLEVPAKQEAKKHRKRRRRGGHKAGPESGTSPASANNADGGDDE